MGTFVDKLNNASGVWPESPYNLIKERIDEISGYASDWADKMAEAVEALQNSIGPGFTTSIDNIHKPSLSIPSVSMPDAPSTEIALNNNWPDTNISDPTLSDVDIDFGNILYPEAPDDEIDSDFHFSVEDYNSCLHDKLCQKITESLVTGGTGLTDHVYNLIIDRAKEARRVVEDAAMQRAVDAVGARGFDFPGGMAAGVLLEVQKETLEKDIDGVNAVAIKDFEIADANEKFIKELAARYEEIEHKSWESAQAMRFEIAKETKEFILRVFETRVNIYISKLEAIKTKIEAKKKQIDAVVANNDSKIKAFLGRVDILKSKIAAISEENKSKTELAKAKADIYKSTVDGVSKERESFIREAELFLQEYQVDVNRAVEEGKMELEAYTQNAGLIANTSDSIAKIAAQAVASSLGAINTHMSYGYSGSESRRYSFNKSLSNNLSESHSYKEE